MYLLIDEDGTIKLVSDISKNASWDSWPKVVEIRLYCGDDPGAFVLGKDGWEELTPTI